MTLPDDDDTGDALDPATLDERTRALQQTVQRLTSRVCTACGAALCGHAGVLAVVLGYQNAPRCGHCLAAALGEPQPALCERSLQWIVRRDCFLHVWRQASASEGFGADDRPRCTFPDVTAIAPAPPVVAPTTNLTAAPVAAAHYDAGDLGCGDLVLELRGRLREQAPGAVLHVTARDPAAPVDLPAWCGLCGHTLLFTSHPDYWIQRKRD